MFTEYQQYYYNPTLQNAKNLWYSITTYDFTEDANELIELRQSIPPKPHLTDIYLASNGSEKASRKYTFGPHSGFWLRQMEDHVKFRLNNQYTTIFPSINAHKIPSFTRAYIAIRESNSTIPIHYMASAAFKQPDAIKYLIGQLQKIGPFGLFSEPNNWLYLLSQQEFREFLINSQLTSAMSTNWEAFYRRPPSSIHFNDNMINWTTGMNFYTCLYNTKHFLPTFIPTPNGIVNLINLTRPAVWPVDDLMIIEPETKKCICGRHYQPFAFIPHINRSIRSATNEIVYDLGLANRLRSHYLNLQFIQYKQIVHVLYITASKEPDIETITEFFARHSLHVEFHRDKYLKLNQKLPVFWSSNTLPKYRNFSM